MSTNNGRLTVVRFGGIVVPNVPGIQRGRGLLADTERTAGGLERSDIVRGWRTWDIRAIPPTDVVEALERHLDKIMWGYDQWWCIDMGGEVDTIARIDAPSWHSSPVLGRLDRRELSFTVIER